MLLKNYFSRIYVINLPARTDRRLEVESMLKRVGIPSSSVHFFPGVQPTEPAGFRTIGARGCFLSHLAILEEALKLNLESVLILEDDLEIIDRFLKEESQIVDFLKSHLWDIVYFGHSLDLKKNIPPLEFEKYTKPIILAHFVGFHQRIIPALVEFLHSLLNKAPNAPDEILGPMDIDGAYTSFRLRFPETTTFVANPSLGYQRSSRGDITPFKWYDNPGILRYLSSKARKLKQLIKKFQNHSF